MLHIASPWFGASGVTMIGSTSASQHKEKISKNAERACEPSERAETVDATRTRKTEVVLRIVVLNVLMCVRLRACGLLALPVFANQSSVQCTSLHGSMRGGTIRKSIKSGY